MKYCPSEEGVDVFFSGYVFRLKLLHERGLDLLNGEGKKIAPYLYLKINEHLDSN